MALWRVQSTWVADGEERHYAPVFRRSKLAAEAERRSMQKTLQHFPTLTVLVRRVSVDERDAEEAALAAAAGPLPTVHLRLADADKTACGLPETEVEVAHDPWFFEFAVTGVEPGTTPTKAREPAQDENSRWRERDKDRLCGGCLRIWDQRRE